MANWLISFTEKKKGVEITPLVELFACLQLSFPCGAILVPLQRTEPFFPLVFMFRNGARVGTKIEPYAERAPCSNKV